MKLTIYQIDAFTDEVFSGNPAAVIILNEWLPTETMQKIALENNLSETAFIVKTNDIYHIRWFAPFCEIDLCGHATLASAYVIFNCTNFSQNKINFHSPISGNLSVHKTGNLLTLNFPAAKLKPLVTNERLNQIIEYPIIESYSARLDVMLVLSNETEIKNLKPNFSLIKQMDIRGLMVTAKGDTTDFVSRFFAPSAGINEDPVTGSAHTALTPYWAKKLNKKMLTAKQLSSRGGNLICQIQQKRVLISGNCALYMKGEINF